MEDSWETVSSERDFAKRRILKCNCDPTMCEPPSRFAATGMDSLCTGKQPLIIAPMTRGRQNRPHSPGAYSDSHKQFGKCHPARSMAPLKKPVDQVAAARNFREGKAGYELAKDGELIAARAITLPPPGFTA